MSTFRTESKDLPPLSPLMQKVTDALGDMIAQHGDGSLAQSKSRVAASAAHVTAIAKAGEVATRLGAKAAQTGDPGDKAAAEAAEKELDRLRVSMVSDRPDDDGPLDAEAARKAMDKRQREAWKQPRPAKRSDGAANMAPQSLSGEPDASAAQKAMIERQQNAWRKSR